MNMETVPSADEQGKFYGCQHKNSDLEGLQSKSRFRNPPFTGQK